MDTRTAPPTPEEKKIAPLPQQRLGSSVGRFGAFGMPAEKTANFKQIVRRMAGMLRPEHLGMVGVFGLAVASIALYVVGPKVLGRATDVIFDGLRSPGGASAIDFAALHRVLWFVLGLYVAAAAFGYLQAWVLTGIVQRTMFRLREDVEAKLNRLPLRYVDGQPRGDLLSRVTNDMDNLAQGMQQTLSQMLTSALTLVGTLVMFVVSWILALVAVVTIPVSIWSMKAITKRSRGKFVSQWMETGKLNALVEESFTGHNIVKAFGRQAEVEARFRVTNEALYDASFGATFISGSIMPSMMLIGNLGFVAIAVVGGLQVASEALTLGAVQAFIQYSRQFSQPLTHMASMVTVFQSGVASAERIFDFLDAEEQSEDTDEALLPDSPAGCIEFERVSFSYDPDRPLIENLSFVAEPGQTVAIVGPTGAGKTTLVNLIMRFYELNAGRILLDGVDIASLSRAELRSKIGMVLQDTWLFGGTIRDNIAYGNPLASEEEIRAAAEATFVDRFVHSLPDGYDTVVSDEDGSISAGEKQLMTIARAFLADPAILILDEATSSVDTRTEVLIQEAMAALRSSRTSFVIAHRLSTIRDADVILVMEGGQIVEQGSHAELLAASGAYARLYEAQFAAPAADVA
jgi:ATP-binding cassette, subfamily B, multidrug efflux pump